MAGCQQTPDAQDGNQTNGVKDRFIGAYVTTEPITKNDDQGSVAESDADDQSKKYPDRIYAEIVTSSAITEDGEKTEDKEYGFKGVKGFSLFAPIEEKKNSEGEPYMATIMQSDFSNVEVQTGDGDGPISTDLKGTLYAVPKPEERKYNIYHVYQSDDGEIYISLGNVMEIADGMGGGIDDSRTIKKDGESITQSCNVELSFENIDKPTKVVILQMDKDNKPVDRQEYEPEKMPENITPDQKASYLIVETHKEKEDMTREIYSRDTAGTEAVNTEASDDSEKNSIKTFFAREDGICDHTTTAIKW